MNQYSVKVKVSPELERAIIRDYCTPEIPLGAIYAKHGVTAWTVNVIRLKWGLRRYRTNAAPKHPTLRKALKKQAAPWDDANEPTPQLWRCPYCHGPSTDKEGHSACIARNQPKGRAA